MNFIRFPKGSVCENKSPARMVLITTEKGKWAGETGSRFTFHCKLFFSLPLSFYLWLYKLNNFKQNKALLLQKEGLKRVS